MSKNALNTLVPRRRFLRESSLLAAAGISAGFLPNLIRAKQAPAIARVKNPNSRLQVGIIGLGAIGQFHIKPAATREALVAVSECIPWHMKKRLQQLREMPDANVPADEVATFADYRAMLAQLGDQLDVVHICTPDHNHAVIAIDCMKAGKHVLVEKPMAPTIEEVYILRDAARKYGVATQMGNQGHTSSAIRRAVSHMRAKSIGEITEVYFWCERDFGGGDANTVANLRKNLNEEQTLWTLPTPLEVARINLNDRGYDGPEVGRVNPNWRSDRRWGTGNLGDFGCHTMDPAFWGLKLAEADRMEIECLSQRYGNEYYFHKTNSIRWKVPARADMAGCTLYWYDGRLPNTEGLKDEQGELLPYIHNVPEKVEATYREHGRKVPKIGAMLFGEKGVLMTGSHAQYGGFLPRELNREIPEPPDAVPPANGDKPGSLYHAIRTGEASSADFEYSAPFTEFVLTGVLAEKAGPGAPFVYDRQARKTDNAKLNQMLTAQYRPGYELTL